MAKFKIEDMKINITYGTNKVDKDRLCSIFIDIIKDLEKEDLKNNENKISKQ
ncbi:hypothetical protein [Clostridioides difficile]|uniref:hypothetical protein n=1 Tax=Clostridioides difficile TaxID=1496 RepID=UPI00131CA034|nr:hypothetical protein [Clostridioides difficile]